MVRYLATHDHLPDYSVSLDTEGDVVIFRNRGSMPPPALPPWGETSIQMYTLRGRSDFSPTATVRITAAPLSG